MSEKALNLPTYYFKNDDGVIVKETNPDEIARLQRESTYKPISIEEGRAAIADKRRVIDKINLMLGGKLSEAPGTQNP